MNRLRKLLEDMAAFTREEVDAGRLSISSRRHGEVRDFSASQEFGVPSGLTSEQWQNIDTDNHRWEVYAHGTGKAPSKNEPVWRVINMNTKEQVLTGLLYKEAVKEAQDRVLLSLKKVKK